MTLNKSKVILLVLIIFMVSCAGKTTRTKGVYHLVKKNETLWKIAQVYNYDSKELSRINNLPESGQIDEGSVIFIPNASEAIDIKPSILQERQVSAEKEEGQKSDKVEVAAGIEEEEKEVSSGEKPSEGSFGASFMWPVTGKVSSKFGRQSEIIKLGDGTEINSTRYNNGIKIDAPEGTPVVASENGTVDKTDTFKYYGKTIIIKHGRGYMTVYSYLNEIVVKEGDEVKKGQTIGLVGKDERSGIPYLHFEVRHNNRAKNPLFYLPK
ncbi:MAG: M23 family metallopeptidase [Deltaproteobacteria bacterium]|nr:M23 family metallopeptidase [Deltaproteobacteria bacterium]